MSLVTNFLKFSSESCDFLLDFKYVELFCYDLNMAERVMNVQDAFLNYLRRNRRPVTVFLNGGIKLCGIIVCFDRNSIVLKRGEYTQLIYKHAISNFFPQGTINLFDWGSPKENTQSGKAADFGDDYEEGDGEDYQEYQEDESDYEYNEDEE